MDGPISNMIIYSLKIFFLILYFIFIYLQFKSKNRDVLNCDRCLRSIGLWLYEKDLNLRSNSGQIENDNVCKKNVLTSQENRLVILATVNLIY